MTAPKRAKARRAGDVFGSSTDPIFVVTLANGEWFTFNDENEANVFAADHESDDFDGNTFEVAKFVHASTVAPVPRVTVRDGDSVYVNGVLIEYDHYEDATAFARDLRRALKGGE